jgi:hypothetical protein
VPICLFGVYYVLLYCSRGGKWFSVRLDLEVAGAMLLRDTDSGSVYAIETTDLPQVRGAPSTADTDGKEAEQEPHVGSRLQADAGLTMYTYGLTLLG